MATLGPTLFIVFFEFTGILFYSCLKNNFRFDFVQWTKLSTISYSFRAVSYSK